MRQLNLVLRLPAFAFCVLFFLAPKTFAQHGPATDAELSVKKLQVAPGLKVELFASAPLFENPVAFSIDERGRFFISETHRYKDSIFDITRQTNWLLNDLSFRTVEDRAAFLQKEFATNINFLTKDSELVRLVEDRDGDGRAETASIFAGGFNQTVSGTAAGILARHGEVWFTCIPDLWKFTESNQTGEGRARHSVRAADDASKNGAQRTDAPHLNAQKLATGFGVHIGVSGHDLHGLVMGPDGKIYFSSGDRGFAIHTKEGKFLNNPDSGGVLRCNPDGSDLEIFATGLRNPQELAFDQYGNLFTDDNDTAGEDKSRLIYVVEGGDYGWRASYQFMDGYGPWVQEKNWLGEIDGTLPLCGEVAQGPAGLAFYPGTGLPEKYQNHFLACDFPKGIWSFAVKPKGASFEVVDKEKFLWNFGATDVDFAPDGSAYALDWGQSYSMPENGRIYRIFDPAQTENTELAEVKNLLAEGMEKRSVEELARLLGHANQRVRLDAQFELVKRYSPYSKLGTNRKLEWKIDESFMALSRTLQESTNPLARIHAMWGVKQICAKWTNYTVLEPVLPLLKNSDPELRAQAAQVFAQPYLHKNERIRAAAVFNLFPLCQDAAPRVRFFALQSLAQLDSELGFRAIVETLKENADQDAFMVHAGVWSLLNIRKSDAIQMAARSENVSVRRAALLAMRRMQRPEIAQFLNDSEHKLILEAARAINDAPINSAMPQLAAMLQRAAELHSAETNANQSALEQLLRRAINANFRLGQNSNALALATFASKTNAPEAMRVEALDALSDWKNPSQLDRVMGLWRPLPGREISMAQNAFHSVAQELFKSDSEKILLATIRCARKLRLDEPELFPLFKTSHSPAVRVKILQTLAETKSRDLPKAVELALADSNPDLRREGIKSIALLSPEKTPVLLEKLLATETDLRIKQTAFATLGNLTNAAAADVLNRQLDLLLAGKIAPELQLDLVEAAARNPDPRLVGKIATFQAKFPKEDALADFRLALAGGDAARGKKIFNEREDVACLRCHAIKGKGGNVGPDLAGMATRQTRDYFLESILEPNKQIAPGFENIVVTLKNGTAVAGLVKHEDKFELVINSPEDGGDVKIKKDAIVRRDPSLSSMPEGMSKMLTKFELRDLIEYLASLK